VQPTGFADDLYEVSVRPANHTLGNLLQGLLYTHWVRDGGARVVSHVGYHMPHPNEETIVIRLKCVRGHGVHATLADGTRWVAAHLQQVADEWEAFAAKSGGKRP
jgi:DNA-directed RNA polymerase subunit L